MHEYLAAAAQEPKRPRVDAALYQATLPDQLQSSASASSSSQPPQQGGEMVWSGRMTAEVHDYLAFCRRLTGGTAAAPALEDDENALRFLLQDARGSVDRAQLLLIAALGGGASFKAVKDPDRPRTMSAPKSKTAYKALIAAAASTTRDATPCQAKPLWDAWVTKAKRALALPPQTQSAAELVLLLHEARRLPLFSPSSSPALDEQHVAQCFDAFFQLEQRARDAEEFVARVHDALSPVRAEEKWTPQELRQLADDAPRKLVVREIDLLKDVASECEQWELTSIKWLKPPPDAAASLGEFTLAQLEQHIADGDRAPADHVAHLAALRRRLADCQAAHDELERVFLATSSPPPPQLSSMIELRQRLARLRLVTARDGELDESIAAAQCVHDAQLPRLSLDELRQLTDTRALPVLAARCMAEKLGELERALVRCDAWLARLAELWPEAAPAPADGEREREPLWLRAAPGEDAMAGLNALLLEDAPPLPVQVPEERELRVVIHTLNWSRQARALLGAAAGTVPLAQFERALEDMDQIAQSFDASASSTGGSRRGGGGGGAGGRRTRRALPVLDEEDALRVVVREGADWLKAASTVIGNSATSAATASRLTYAAFCEVVQRRPQVAVDAALAAQVEAQAALLTEWQQRTSDRLQAAAAAVGDKKITEQELAELLKQAEQWAVDTPELAALHALAGEVREWKEQCAVLALPASEDDEKVEGGGGGGEEKAAPGGEGDDVAELPLQQPLPPTAAAPASSKPKRRGKQYQQASWQQQDRADMGEEDLAQLRQRGLAMPVRVSLHEVDACMQATLEWKRLVQGPLQRYRDAVCQQQQTPGDDDNEAGLTGASSSGGPTLLHQLGLVNADERFPAAQNVSSSSGWRERALPVEAEDALDELAQAMQEADERQLHRAGLDSSEVRSAAWLIQASSWLARVDDRLKSGSGAPYSLLQLCHAVYAGVRLLEGPSDETMDAFPDRVLDSFLQTSLPYSKRPKLASSVDQQQQQQNSTGGAGEDAESAAAASAAWASILKHVRVASASEAEEQSSSGGGISYVMACRLRGLTRASQRYFAVRALWLTTIARVPRGERTLDALRRFAQQAQQPPEDKQRAVLAASPEELSLERECAASEQFSVDSMRALQQRPLPTVHALERLAGKADKVWADPVSVAQIKATAKHCRGWLDRAHDALDGAPASTVRKLVQEGVEWSKTVCVAHVVQQLRQVTDVVCMCRGARRFPAATEMMACVDCKDVFHKECITSSSSAPSSASLCCPVCQAKRAVDKLAGYGYAALCRVLALELLDHDVPAVDNAACRAALQQWMRLAAHELQQGAQQLPPVPSLLANSPEVRSVAEAHAALKFGAMLDKLRIKPTLGELEYTLSQAPLPSSPMMTSSLAALQSILARGRALSHACDEVWRAAAADNAPASIVLAKCHEAARLFPGLPLDMAEQHRQIQMCIEDAGERHCLCHRLDYTGRMVRCRHCSRRFHSACVGGGEDNNDTYTCRKCADVVLYGGGA